MELLFSYILICCLWFPSLWREVMTYSLIYHGLTNKNYAISHWLKLQYYGCTATTENKNSAFTLVLEEEIFCILCPLIYATWGCLDVHKLRPCKHPIFSFWYLEILCWSIWILMTVELVIIMWVSLYRLFLMLQRFPVESKGRRKKLNEVLCYPLSPRNISWWLVCLTLNTLSPYTQVGYVTTICFGCFLIRCIMVNPM